MISLFALFFSALLGAQRYLFEDLYAYACVIPLVLALTRWRECKLRNTYLLLSVFLTVDITAGVYFGTPGVLRYAIYIAAIVSLLEGFRFSLRALSIAGFLFLFWLAMAVMNNDAFGWGQFYRDIQLFLIATIVLVRTDRSITSHEVDFDIIKKFIFLAMISELMNLIFFHELASGYLSLSSTKSFICVTMLVALSKRNFSQFLLYSVLTGLVVAAYGQRMILVVLFLAIGIYLILNSFKSKKVLLLSLGLFVPVVLIVVIVLIPYLNSIEGMSGNRSIYLVQAIAKGVSWDLIRSLDQVRFDEHNLFLSRDIFSIIFGEGFGIGIYDVENVFSYVQPDQFGFSNAELESRIFFGFHDYWTTVGLRFGILAAILPCILLIKGFSDREFSLVTHSMVMFVLLLCSFYSVAGLIMIALIALSYRQKLIQAKNGK